jgi:drug/metabolite transporter (DMT)-like permease
MGADDRIPGATIPGSRRYLVGIGLILLAAACFASHNVFSKLSFTVGAGGTTLLAVRAWLAVFLLYLLVRANRSRIRVPRSVMWIFLLATLFNITQNPAIIFSFTYIKVSLSVLILYLFPIIVSVMAITIGGERATVTVLGAAVLGFAGVALVIQAETSVLDWRGIGLSAYAALGLACTVFFAARLGREMGALVIPFLFMLISAPIFTAWMLLDGGPHWPTLDGAWIFVIAVTTLPLALSFFYSALPRAGAPRASLIMNSEPLMTVALAAAFAGEFLAPLQLLGGGFILMAIFWIAISRQKPEH